MFKNLSELIDLAKSKELRKLAVAAADDEPVLKAVMQAANEKIIEPVLVGNEDRIRKIASKLKFDVTGIKIVDEKNLKSIVRIEAIKKRAIKISRSVKYFFFIFEQI